MTYCLGILLNDGLVLAADSRTNAGVDQIALTRKMTLFERPGVHLVDLALDYSENTRVLIDELQAKTCLL